MKHRRNGFRSGPRAANITTDIIKGTKTKATRTRFNISSSSAKMDDLHLDDDNKHWDWVGGCFLREPGRKGKDQGVLVGGARRRRIQSCTSLLIVALLLMLQGQVGPVEARIGYFWHITDLHFDSLYTTKGDILRSCWYNEHHSTSNTKRPGPFGDYLCDSPWSLLESATQAMKSKQGDNVEFVLWTGDGLSHSAKRLHETSRLELLRNITELMSRTFPSQFVFPVLGHDDGSSNYVQLGEMWRHWLPTEALQTFEKGGYYTIEQTKSRLRIIALNTNFMRHDPKYPQSHSSAVKQRPDGSIHYTGGMGGSGGHFDRDAAHRHYHRGDYSIGGSSVPGYPVYSDRRNVGGYGGGSGSSSSGIVDGSFSSGGSGVVGSVVGGGHVSALSGSSSHESEKQWEWLEDVLAKSSRNKETVYIVGHIPPGSDERHYGHPMPYGHTSFTEKNNARYLRLVKKYSSIIQGQFFGHLHSDSFRVVYSDNGKPVSWMMIAPSITPRRMSDSNNPAMRLYKFDTDTGQVLDYTQYYLDLEQANLQGEAIWQPEYNLTTHYYGLGEVSAMALHNLADRFTNGEDTQFAKYYRANSVRHSTQTCEGACLLNHYCAITRLDYREFRSCLETAAKAMASKNGGGSSGMVMGRLIPLMALLVLAAMFGSLGNWVRWLCLVLGSVASSWWWTSRRGSADPTGLVLQQQQHRPLSGATM
ncbi:acid sphingomyelinase-like phosphodiesterase 3b [Uranotaenia lowii]|uniref:acid sphingomyelinase-like phosphodiesterase 3b n=1 Tax=Uranotaenia lowii TaxID=190385 RepID=UPI00247B15ED|nr:acid sphingomyelinase-like phosphodiesterase 3b [Uranotaenia lowii]XP_055608616.1 acid sphingomyelinase-like phosphodiesterase 3b [Uranotaenia lowii]XP_055608617.1 acid sphingomyelinase-like phosphodiesterase 3b [Uranotaenia lowii]XP_055608618.1 acid sphingomyelinase-like phosphodiesterase 3b [Uranotaenia lowii]XP_055608619.1 acid sphingomyelinase-like phosphodiesterase 3b [Uranotaenia lowii]XP_055608620.1 acid sphingomyelinase-like phosphodiesterase 3b [Uranotaenia lowii]XP_055608621.1 ac